MNKRNNKKVGLRSARMRQLAGMRQLTPADSFQALTVTVSSSTPPITTLTLTANNIYSSTSKSNSYLYTEKALNNQEDPYLLYLCNPRNIYFFLSTDIIIYENKDNIENIIISVQGKSTFIKFSDVTYEGTESLSSFFSEKEYDKQDKYVFRFRVKVGVDNSNNLLFNGYYNKTTTTEEYFCKYTKLAFSLSSFNPL